MHITTTILQIKKRFKEIEQLPHYHTAFTQKNRDLLQVSKLSTPHWLYHSATPKREENKPYQRWSELLLWEKLLTGVWPGLRQISACFWPKIFSNCVIFLLDRSKNLSLPYNCTAKDFVHISYTLPLDIAKIKWLLLGYESPPKVCVSWLQVSLVLYSSLGWGTALFWVACVPGSIQLTWLPESSPWH